MTPFPHISSRLAYGLLALMMIAYIIFQGNVALRLHHAFVTSANDLSNIDQVVWNSQNGRILERTSGTRSVPRYGEHLEPIWIALGLLYLFWDDVSILLWAQTFALAAAALPVFWFASRAWGNLAKRKKQHTPKSPCIRGVLEQSPNARGFRGVLSSVLSVPFSVLRHLTSPPRPLALSPPRPFTPSPTRDYGAGLIFAAIYLLSPFVGRANSAEVHAMPFAIAPMLLALFWGWQGQWKRVAPLVILLLLVREDAGLLVIAFGLWIGLTKRARKASLALIVSGLVGFIGSVFGIIAYFADERFSGREESIFFERYAAFGEGAWGIIWGMLTRFDVWQGLIGEPLRLTFLADFFGSTGGLALFSPLAWLLFAPHFILNFFSDYFAQYGGLQHYAAPLVPGLMVASILGGAELLKRGHHQPALRLSLLVIALGGAILSAQRALWQPLAASWIQPPVTAHHRLLSDIAAAIPARAPLSTDPQLHPHLAHRPDAYRFPKVADNTEWLLVDVTTNRTQHPADVQRELLSLLAQKWGIVRAEDGYLLLAQTEKVAPHSNGRHTPKSPCIRGVKTGTPRMHGDLGVCCFFRLALLERGGTNKRLPEPFFTFAYATEAPQVPLYAQFGEQIELLGYDIKQDFWGRVLVQWHLRPLMPLPPTLTVETALFNGNFVPLPDTEKQPLTLLYWLPLSEWQVGKSYLLTTLPRQGAESFWPALTVRHEGLPLRKEALASSKEPARFTEWGEWLVGGEWRLEDNHAQRGEAGWRQWEAPAPLAEEAGEWDVARLAAWEVELKGEPPFQELHLTLHWQAKQNGEQPTQRFVHLVPKEGVPIPITQLDGPLGGEYAITQWLKDEWISEVVILTLPAESPPEWHLLVGLYDPVSQERLPVEPDAGSNTFELHP